VGIGHAEIARELGTTRTTVDTWVRRFRTAGIDGLADRVRTGRHCVVEDTEVILRTLTTRPAGPPGRPWSSRHLRPAALQDFRLPATPGVSARIAEAVGLYRDAQHALLVVRVDKSPLWRYSVPGRPPRPPVTALSEAAWNTFSASC
jgi:hypothetical protein